MSPVTNRGVDAKEAEATLTSNVPPSPTEIRFPAVWGQTMDAISASNPPSKDQPAHLLGLYGNSAPTLAGDREAPVHLSHEFCPCQSCVGIKWGFVPTPKWKDNPACGRAPSLVRHTARCTAGHVGPCCVPVECASTQRGLQRQGLRFLRKYSAPRAVGGQLAVVHVVVAVVVIVVVPLVLATGL